MRPATGTADLEASEIWLDTAAVSRPPSLRGLSAAIFSIVVSLTFFGAESPYRDCRGGDLIATQMSLVGYETPINQATDLPNEPPLKPKRIA